MSDIYTNTPANQKVFDEFWGNLETKKEALPKSCDQMVRQTLKDLNTFNPDDTFSLDLVKELLMQCLRGC